MKRILFVTEIEGMPIITFRIYEVTPNSISNFKPGIVSSFAGDPLDPFFDGVITKRALGLYDANEQAQRAAAQYAAERGLEIVKWQLFGPPSEFRGDEPDLEAGARPIGTAPVK